MSRVEISRGPCFPGPCTWGLQWDAGLQRDAGGDGMQDCNEMQEVMGSRSAMGCRRWRDAGGNEMQGCNGMQEVMGYRR